MPMMLFTNQYRESPAGNLMKNHVIIIGMMVAMLFCAGSVMVDFCWKYIAAPISSGSRPIPVIPRMLVPNGRSISGFDRSVIQSTNPAP